MIQQIQKNKTEWREVELGTIFEFEGKTGIKAGEGLGEGKYKFFTSSDNQSKFLDRFNFKGDHLIFSTGGKAGLHYCNEPFSVSNDCFIVKVNNHSTKFIYYLLKSRIYLLEKGFKGAGLRHLSKEYLKKIKVRLPFLPDGTPDLKEQERILKILEEAEKIKSKREGAEKLFDDYLKSVFSEMFSNKGFKSIKFSEAGELARGKSKHRPRNDPSLLGGKYPLIQTGEVANANVYIKRYSQTYSDIGLKQSKLWKKGTLCITIAANIANTAILDFDACFPDSIVGFKPNNNFRTEYVLFWINSIKKRLEDLAPQVAQKNINLGILSELDIPCPPILLQQKFSRIVEHIEKMKENLRKTKQNSEELFNSLMSKAFRGEL